MTSQCSRGHFRGVIAIGGTAVLAYRLVSGQFSKLPRIHSIRGLMITTVISPVAALSYFPHQEPRFLIPLLLPVVFLYGQCFMGSFTKPVCTQ
ncbi:hypothetical protein CBL_13994 [Carabus blaptoides fortunei]